jgi:hypothetical protein
MVACEVGANSELVLGKVVCDAGEMESLRGAGAGVYRPLPCWSWAFTRGVYRGRGPPLPAGG